MSERESEATQQEETAQQEEAPKEEGARYDAPNQQVVRADQSGPADEGTGGEPGELPQAPGSELDAMTKDELLDHARSLGVSPANAAMTKDELRHAIDTHAEEEAAEE